MTDPDFYTRLAAPSLDDFSTMADRAFKALPENFRRLCEGVIFRVEDFPDDETLTELGLESEFDLLGLFRGVGMPQQGSGPQTGQLPNAVYLFRRPILDYWAEHEETLGAIITHVLVHEIGHHLGFSDDDMTAIEQAATSDTSH